MAYLNKVQIALKPYEIPFVTPIKINNKTIDARRGIILQLSKNGAYAQGEIAPLEGLSSESLNDAHDEARYLSDGKELNCPSGQFGFESAMMSLYSQSCQLSLSHCYNYYFGNQSNFVPSENVLEINGLISGNCQTWILEALRQIEKGYRCIKIKVARNNFMLEAETLCKLRKILGPKVKIRLDANRGWNLFEAEAFCRKILSVKVEYIEEPCDSLAHTLLLAKLKLVPLALDESLNTCKYDFAFFDQLMGLLQAVIVKPTLIGSLQKIHKVIEMSKYIGAKVIFTSAYESVVGLSHIAAIANAVEPNEIHGLSTFEALKYDTISPPFRAFRGSISF